MSVVSAVCYEVRCKKCYQSNYLPVDVAGTKFVCKTCNANEVAPQPTTETIERAAGRERTDIEPTEAFSTDPISTESISTAAINTEPTNTEQPLTREQIARIAKQRSAASQAQKHPTADPGGFPASRIQRFAAQIIDAIVTAIVFGISAVSIAVLGNMGLVEIPNLENVPPEQAGEFILANFPVLALLVFCFFPLGLHLIQWSMISSHGQTIGKKVMFIRIVNDCGNPPGFVQGVVTRNWIRNVLCIIPFFGLVDILCIFGASKRCIHDLMAGSYVVAVPLEGAN